MRQYVIIPTDSASGTPLTAFTSSANIITPPIWVAPEYGFFVQATWTGSGTGTFTIQCSADIEAIPGTADATIVNWTTVANTSTASSSGSPIVWNISNVMYRWMRVVYTVATGSITLTERIQIKGMV